MSQLILSMGPYLSAPSAEKPRSKGGQDFCLRELFVEQARGGESSKELITEGRVTEEEGHLEVPKGKTPSMAKRYCR